MFGGGVWWLRLRAAAAARRGEGFGTHPKTDADSALAEDADLPGIWLAMAPVISVIAVNAALTYLVIPNMDTAFLAEARYGATTIDSVRGIWAIIASLVVSILLAIGLNLKRLSDLKETVNKGTMGSLLPVFNTSSEVGYGAVIASLPAFLVIRDAVLNIAPGNPLISLAVAVNVLAGITGSASGGLSIALQTLGAQFAEMAQAAGIRVLSFRHEQNAALSSGGFDALPHNGAVITLLAICGLTHKQSYPDIFVVAVAIPVFATVVVVVLGSMGA